MTKVFVGGSRHAARLDAQVLSRLDNIMDKGFPVVIGDASGADKAVQIHFHRSRYRNVEVFCSNGVCRNNVGDWPTRNIPVTGQARGVQFFSAKDRAMAEEATIGFMVWDGKSVGTMLNVLRLVDLHKQSVVYVIPEKVFLTIKDTADWDIFLNGRDLALRQKIGQRAMHEAEPKSRRAQPALLA